MIVTIRVLAMSDLHVEFEPFTFSLEETPDLLVLAGDIGPGPSGVSLAKAQFPGPFPKVVIAGNHEFYRADYDETIEICRSAAAAADNVHFLEQDERIFEINDRRVRVLGCILWTDFSVNGAEHQHTAMTNSVIRMNDFRLIRFRGSILRPEDTIEMHRASRRWLDARLRVPHEGPTIVVTHHAPSDRSQPPQFMGGELAPAFTSDLEDLVQMYQPELWIHGHTHWSVDYRIGKTRVYSNQRGYPSEVCGFHREMIEL
jgi:predicted phosphodiesterase